MAQSVFSKFAIADLYGQPGTVANPPANFARLYYNAGSNQLICVDSNGNNLITGGSGSVSTFTGDGTVLSNSGSTGAVTATLATHAANTVFAGPASGSAAAPTFRLLTAADLTSASGGSISLGGMSTYGLTKQVINLGTTGSGDVDVFTVPAGMRAIITFDMYNTAGTTTTYHAQMKKGGIGSYIRIASDATLATNVAVATGFFIIFEAGDIVSMNFSQAGMNFFGTAIVYPNTEGLKSIYFAGPFASGENTVYTCPAGKTATGILTNPQISASSTSPVAIVANSSGGSLNYFLNVVKNGNSPGSTSKQGPATAVGNGVSSAISTTANFAFAAGDFLSVNASGAGAGIFHMMIQEA